MTKKRYTTREIQAMFGWSSAGQVAQAARQEANAGHPWGRQVSQGRGRIISYLASDIDAYDLARRRSPLLRELGWKAPPWEPSANESGRGRTSSLCRSDEYDIPCPICAGLAVRYKERTLCEKQESH